MESGQKPGQTASIHPGVAGMAGLAGFWTVEGTAGWMPQCRPQQLMSTDCGGGRMGSDALTVLTEARAVGLEVRAEPGRLVVRGPRSLETVAQRLLERKREVSALLAAEDADVAWRIDAMRPQVPQRGAIPVLVAREGRTDTRVLCLLRGAAARGGDVPLLALCSCGLGGPA